MLDVNYGQETVYLRIIKTIESKQITKHMKNRCMISTYNISKMMNELINFCESNFQQQQSRKKINSKIMNMRSDAIHMPPVASCFSNVLAHRYHSTKVKVERMAYLQIDEAKMCFKDIIHPSGS